MEGESARDALILENLGLVAEAVRQALVNAMAAPGRHKYPAARLLGITPRGLYNKLIAFGLYTPKSARSGNRRGGERVKKGKPKPKPKPPKPDRYESP